MVLLHLLRLPSIVEFHSSILFTYFLARVPRVVSIYFLPTEIDKWLLKVQRLNPISVDPVFQSLLKLAAVP